jgi:beta-phosphoglucomutase-like phosphatase (HAD superfamily)
MIEAVIFDSDGVLVNTDQYHYLSWKAIADKEGIYFDSEINNQMRGISREDSLNVLLKRADKEYTLPEKEATAGQEERPVSGLLGAADSSLGRSRCCLHLELAEEERHQVSRGFVVKINSSRLRESGPS